MSLPDPKASDLIVIVCTFQRWKLAALAEAGVKRFLRWMLFLVLALNLVGSPLHTHLHLHGIGSNSSAHVAGQKTTPHASHSQAAAGHESSSHIDTHGALHGDRYLISASPNASLELAEPDLLPRLLALVPLFVLLGLSVQPLVESLVRWRPDRERVRIPSFRSIPPHGRAPPSLRS